MENHFCDSLVMMVKETQHLRKRLDNAGCVFEFVTMVVDAKVQVDEQIHRYVLAKLYEQIMAGQIDWHRKVVRMLPAGDYPGPNMNWNIGAAKATRLRQEHVLSLSKIEASEVAAFPLYADFCRSLYLPSYRSSAGIRQALFVEWIDTLGLQFQDEITVLSWTDTPYHFRNEANERKYRCAWTDFFCPDSMHQHTWCLTIWNSKRRTISALAACSTLRQKLSFLD